MAAWRSAGGLQVVGFLAVVAVGTAGRAPAQPTHAETAGVFTIADGADTLEAPAGWERVPPKSRMIEAEFSVPAADGEAAGRMTVMGAGGSIEANIDRWCGQFSQPDGSATRDKTTTKKLEVAGCEVTLVDIVGTFTDMPGGPFAGGQAVQRPGYRMLAAIARARGSVAITWGSNDTTRAVGSRAGSAGGTAGAADDGSRGILKLAAHVGQMPCLPASASLTLIRWPFGHHATMPIADPSSGLLGPAATRRRAAVRRTVRTACRDSIRILV